MDHAISIDPARCFGRPRIKGTGVPTGIIRDRFLAGEPIVAIAYDYALPESAIETALRFEMTRRRKRPIGLEVTE